MKKFLTTRLGRGFALGLFAFFCLLMSATSASAQTWVSEAQAVTNLTQKCQAIKSELQNPPSDPKAAAYLMSRYHYMNGLLSSIQGGSTVQNAYGTVGAVVLNTDPTSYNVAITTSDAKSVTNQLRQEAFDILTI